VCPNIWTLTKKKTDKIQAMDMEICEVLRERQEGIKLGMEFLEELEFKI
jgi:hypothetical protein